MSEDEEIKAGSRADWTAVVRCPHGRMFPLPLDMLLHHHGYEHTLSIGCGCPEEQEEILPKRKSLRKWKRQLRKLKADDFNL